MGKDFIIQFKPDSERGNEFKRLFGRDEFHVESPTPEYATIPGFEEPQKVFLLDLKFLTSRDRIILVRYLANKFNLSLIEVELSLDEGVPILDQDVYLTVLNPLRYLL